jgi:hypothetical protein
LTGREELDGEANGSKWLDVVLDLGWDCLRGAVTKHEI